MTAKTIRRRRHVKRLYAVEVIEKRLVSLRAAARKDAIRRVNAGQGDYMTEGGDEVAVRARLYNPDKKYAVLQVRTNKRA